MNTTHSALLGIALCLALSLPPSARAAGAREIELVLALDTTGSMGGLLERAKVELWGVVDQLARQEPTPRIRIGIVAYRDRGDSYVTQVHGLDADIDAVHGRLRGLQPGGGGDHRESVNQGLYDAVHAMDWSPRASVERAVVLAGDAPPHMDYPDDVPWPGTVRVARSRGIAIHTIQCGSDAATRDVWQAIAQQAGGHYAPLPHTPGRAAGTPFDAQLAALNRELTGTVVPYGESAERDELARALEGTLEADEATAAARASYLGRRGEASTSRDGDLTDRLARGELRWDEIEQGRLPDALRDLDPGERRQRLEDRIARRRGLLSEIAYLSDKRDAHLRETRDGDGFQAQVLRALGSGGP